MEITISSEIEKIIQYKIDSGRYENVSEFIREAILQSVEKEQLKISKLNEAISIGFEQAEKGKFSKRSVQDIIKDNQKIKNI